MAKRHSKVLILGSGAAGLTAAPNVSHVKSALTIRASKIEPGVPVRMDE